MDTFQILGLIIMTGYAASITILLISHIPEWAIVNHSSKSVGLWSYCNPDINFKHSKEPLVANLVSRNVSSLTLTSTPISETPVQCQDDYDAEIKELRSRCTMVFHCEGKSLKSQRDYLLVVRLLTFLALLCICCSLATLIVSVRRAALFIPKFDPLHLGQVLNFIGAALGILAVEIYRSNYKSDKSTLCFIEGIRGPNGEQGGDLLELGWYAWLQEATVVAFIPIAFLLLFLTLCYEWKKHKGRSTNHCFWTRMWTSRAYSSGSSFMLRTNSSPSSSDLAVTHPPAASRNHSSERDLELLPGTWRNSAFSINDSSAADVPTNRREDYFKSAPRYEELVFRPAAAPDPHDSTSCVQPPPTYGMSSMGWVCPLHNGDKLPLLSWRRNITLCCL